MVTRRTVDLLPEIFRTNTNKKFLAATLDQLTQEPAIKRTQGFVGRRVGPGVNPSDNYVLEPTQQRANYQLEPGVCFLAPQTNRVQDAITYPGLLDSISTNGGDTGQQDRLWSSEYYTWDPFCDLDKFANYSQYYWLPGGPDSVDVSTQGIPLTDDFVVSRSTTAYRFSQIAGDNPTLTLVRGGNYTFQVDQPGHKFFIQAAPGIDGVLPAQPNISSRDVLGVTNNGAESGEVTFDVPLKTAQDFFYTLPQVDSVDLITDLRFNEINNVYLDNFLALHPNGIDGITSLDQRTLVFSNTITSAFAGGWQITTQFDPLTRTEPNQVGAWVSYDVNGEPYDDQPYETQKNIVVSGEPDPLDGFPGSFDSLLFDQTTNITSQAQRYSVWRINLVTDNDGRQFMQLSVVREVPNLVKFKVLFGSTNSSTSWYKTSSGYFQKIPLLTAVEDVLYYQDSTNPGIFGRIKLVDSANDTPIDVNDIIGAQIYTSPNNIVFTNGLKIQLRGPTIPAEYQDQEFYVEGVGTGPGLDARVGFVDGEAYFGPFHTVNNQKITGLPGSETFQQFIYDTVQESLANRGQGTPTGAPLSITSQFGAASGNGIRLVPVRELITPETYTRSETIPFDSTLYDATPFDAALDAPVTPDYITINRSSSDRNAWSRSNRWFHVDVIRYSAEINNVVPVINNDQRAKRPIVEFRANLDLWNSGTQGIQPVDVIDFAQTDALSNVNGTIGYGVDGFEFLDGTRVIFAADLDPQVRNRVYTVRFILPDGDPNTPRQINLVPDLDGILLYQMVVCQNGLTQKGLSFWFDGSDWQQAQQKTRVNQPPLFDVFDEQGFSLGDRSRYPSSDFAGTQLFGYAIGDTQITDEVLGFALKYLNINNVGDILFTNFLYTDTFRFVADNVGVEQPISQGFVRQYLDRVSFSNQIGWQPAITENRARQIFRFVYDGADLVLDIPADTESILPALQIFVEGVYVDPGRYTVTVQGLNTFVSFLVPPLNGDLIEVQVLSPITSSVGYYQVPINLESNPLNENSSEYTLGTIRSQYESIAQNLKLLQGAIIGNNNTRDLGNIIPYGQNIIQHSSPIPLAAVFLREPQFDVLAALTFNDREYSKYKAQMLNLATKGDFINLDTSAILDQVMLEIALARSENSPFYWSDMIPSGDTYTEIVSTVTPISTQVFDTTQVYDFDNSNYRGLSVYLNGRLLTRKYDYVTGDGVPTVTLLVDLEVGDVVTIREYSSTVGSFVPNTPTKIGLYPAYRPEIYLDESYVTPTLVIRGHDGSITVAYGDRRDDILLEFETRIFNNLKVSADLPIEASSVIPGQFRPTDYALEEVTEILSEDFLSWVGWNKLDYITQDYLNDNEFTFNYRQAGDKLDARPLLGAWRGIYNFFYDTIYPTTRPWEMLGFGEAPIWWEDTYGPAPYTSGNLVLWEDLEAGIVRDPLGTYVKPRYVRPGLTRVIPAGSEGELLSPLQCVVGNYNADAFRKSWTFGDDGPTESAWRTSSSWPFAVMRLLLLTKPAQFFSLGVDRDRYRFDTGIEQWLWDGRYRLDAKQLAPLYGSGVSKASYINWIVDYNRQLGTQGTDNLTEMLANIDVRLCWRAAGFTDKTYLKIYAERSTPTGSNAGLLLPDESYQVLLYKNQAFDTATYSSVIVQRTIDGWAVFGYNPTAPYFNIVVSRAQGLVREIQAGGSSVRVPTEYTNRVARVPYGFVFVSRAAVCDFLLSYGETLRRQGFVFDTVENGYILDWDQMAQEFLYWSNQGWITGSLINLNPGATKISVTRPGAVAESIVPARPDNLVLNQNRVPLDNSQLVIDRFDNTFAVSTLNSQTINFLNLRLTSYEHTIVLDNRSIFADLVYDPSTGARQSRVRINGILSAEWNGTVNAPGFVINQDNIRPWSQNRKYTKGDIVLFKDQYWVASTIIEPSQEFNYALWLKSDFDQVMTGLLPNAANASDQLANAYNVNTTNLEQEIDLFAYGLIGFRPRDYMAALDLNDVSQVNLYRQFISIKGTRPAAEIFSLADLGKETAEYRIYEYWAIQQSLYGANANRSYFELLLDEADLTSDPSVVQVIDAGQTSQADQVVLLQNVWKESYKLTSPDILPVLRQPITDLVLPSAGYVNLDDVDLTVFDIDNVTPLTLDLNQIGVGTRIWVAKVNPYDWNVYGVRRVDGLVLQVSDNLNGLALVTFDRAHGLTAGNILIIKFFDSLINGAYRVSSVPNIFSVLIPFSFTGAQTSVSGQGVALTLDSLRFAQASDLVDLDAPRLLLGDARVWIDQSRSGQWQVLEKTQPWTNSFNLEVPQPIPPANSEYGHSISQGFFNLTALIGAPGYVDDFAPNSSGAVFAFGLGSADQLEFNSRITSSAALTERFGDSIDVGDQTWAVVGAPASADDVGYSTVLFRQAGSDFIQQRQVLVASDTDQSSAMEFGAAVTMSQDERYMYIGAPAVDKVYAYARIDVEQQSVSYVTDGTTTRYNWSDHIVLPTYAAPLQTQYPEQLSVVLGTTSLVYNVDWVLDGDDVVLSDIPLADQDLILTRRTRGQIDSTLYQDIEPAVSVTSAGTGARFNVEVLRGAYVVTVAAGGENYEVGDSFTILGTQIGGASPANDLNLAVTAPLGQTYRGTVTAGLRQFSVNTTQGLDVGQEIVKTSGDGTFPSSPVTIVSLDAVDNTLTVDVDASVSGFIEFYGNPGAVSNFSQSGTAPISNTFLLYENFATVTDIWSFTVQVNETIYRPSLDYSYDQATGILDFDVTSPPLGSEILITAESHFTQIGIIDPVLSGDRFGASASTTSDGRQFMIGAPATDQSRGKAYIYLRGWQKFIVSDANDAVFETYENITAPTAVKLNGSFLINSDFNINGEYTVDYGTNQITISRSLAVGDVVEIETNSFTLLEQLVDNAPLQGAEYGARLDQCVNDCSLYVAAPRDGQRVPQGGHVELLQNQSRLYGTITSQVANPTLTPGSAMFVNGVLVQASGTSVAAFVDDVNNSLAPNVTATSTPDLFLTGDGSTKTFNIGTLYSAASSYTTVVYLGTSADDIELLTAGIDYTYNNTNQTITFASIPFDGAYIKILSGRITLSVTNALAGQPLDLLSVLPASGSALFADLGFDVYVYQQTILPPVDQDYARFGSGLFISDDTTTLAVGAPNGSMIQPTVFDNATTSFDASSTTFSDTTVNSGAVYIYNLLDSYQPSISNPSQFVFGQQIINAGVKELDKFGQAIDITTGIMLIGAPANDLGDSSGDYGTVFQVQNTQNSPAWSIRRSQQPVVDIALLNSLYIYNLPTGQINTWLDYFDPLQGKLLGVVRQNLNYIGAVNPAQFNVGLINNRGMTWTNEHVGEMWWDTTNCRFIDPNQDDITYASRRWGQTFPGSEIEVYQWVASSVPPAEYSGPGVPRSNTSYSVLVQINEQGILQEQYYFWVRGVNTVNRDAGKTLSTITVAQYIENPRGSGIPYLAPINSSTVALYNSLEYIDATDTILHVEFDREFTDNAVHTQYQLIAANRARDFLNDLLYRKLLDSLSGSDLQGNLVPDPFLSPSERYGVAFRPRQSMFVDRFLALKNYLTTANAVLLQVPAAERRSSRLLNSAEPEPSASSGAWDQRVADLTELGYQDLREVSVGYRYLVVSDASNRGLWTIYEVQSGALGVRELRLLRVQNFDTRKYWNFVDWYRPGFDPSTRISQEVPVVADLDTLTLPVGSAVKVTSDAQGRWEIYVLEISGWQRVALQSGTIQFSAQLWDYSIGRFGFDVEVFDAQYFDQEPTTETRQILRAINEEIFIDDLLIERNRLLILMFDFILSEQPILSWLSKTSLIDVDHVIRELLPFQLYRQDNQNFVLNYIQEVKPYHTQIREFNLIYRGQDVYQGTLTDFDLPAQWDSSQQLFVSPILDDGDVPFSTTSSVPSTSPIWQQFPYNQWYNNYLLSIQSVEVVDGGENYTSPPQVIVTGNSTKPAVMLSRINSAGQVAQIIVVDPGQGYTQTAEIVLEGGNGNGARAVARMGNQVVRGVKTVIKYDRYQYNTDIIAWQADTAYAQDTRVRHVDRVWQAVQNVPAQTEFDSDQWLLIPAGDLSGVDRTMGYYVPTPEQPGLDLALLISGVSYPGVQVSAPRFDQNTGFDVGAYDINVFDNISFNADGFPSYDPAILDAIYESDFTDPFLGVNPSTGAAIPDPRPGAVEVDGGGFVDTFSSHAPEELVPGAVFDTLDLRVFTTPGSDWIGDGHGFPTSNLRFDFDSSQPVVDFGGLLTYTLAVTVINGTSGTLLLPGANYSIDWPAQTLRITSGATDGDTVSVTAAALGGGNQLVTRSIVGDGTTDRVIMPRSLAEIYEMVVFVNGQQTFDFSLASLGPGRTAVIFDTVPSVTQRVTVTALGFSDVGLVGWSLPLTQYWVSDGSSSLQLDNSMQGTNPANIVVTRNGRRAVPAAGIDYTADGSTTTFLLPDPGNYSLDLVADNDVSVFVDNEPLILGIGFVVDAFDISSLERTVTLIDVPDPGSRVLVSVRTGAQYFVVGNILQFRSTAGFLPQVGDVIGVTTWNDTKEQDLLTRVFVGPQDLSVLISQGYDTTIYDEGNVTGESGSFDFASGESVAVNRFNIGRNIAKPDRLLVSLDGRFLLNGLDFTLEGSDIVLPGPAISATSVLAATLFTDSTVPGEIAFRIFQDMRGQQTLYRITAETSTELAQDLSATADVINVVDAARMPVPDLAQGIFGLITINGERIAYRVRDTVTNQLRGLRRGTAGTAASSHVAGTAVYTINASNALQPEYQNAFVEQTFLADGVTTTFATTDISVTDLDSTEATEAVQVFVGGQLQAEFDSYTLTASDPVTVEFDIAPTLGYQIKVRVLRGKSFYQPGIGTASNGVALQETDTLGARFIRGN